MNSTTWPEPLRLADVSFNCLVGTTIILIIIYPRISTPQFFSQKQISNYVSFCCRIFSIILHTSKYMITTRDRSITHIVANMRFDQNLDLTAGEYCNICDLNPLNIFPPPLFLALSCSNAPPNIEIRQK